MTKDIKWEDHLCFNVGAKMFLVTTPDAVPPNATFKVTDEEFDEIAAREGFKPAAYMAAISGCMLTTLTASIKRNGLFMRGNRTNWWQPNYLLNLKRN